MIDVEILGRKPAVLTRGQIIRTVAAAVRTSRRKPEGEIAVAFVTARMMRGLNRRHRGKDRPTDVLSFALADFRPRRPPRSLRAGDLFISPATVRQDARDLGVGYRDRLVLVIAHGTLHLMGYDHAKPTEARRMSAMQQKVVDKVL